MPGAHCAIEGCGTCRNQKEYGIFFIPSKKKKDPFTVKWRSEVINIITRDRVVNTELKENLKREKNCVWTCQRHYDDKDIYFYPTRRLLKDGVLPHKNLPEKSIPKTVVAERSTSAIEKREASSASLLSKVEEPKSTYKDFNDFMNRAKLLKLNSWNVSFTNNDYVLFSLVKQGFVLPNYEVYVLPELSIIVRVFGWQVPASHPIFTSHRLDCTTISTFLKELVKMDVCPGLVKADGDYDHLAKHVIPMAYNPTLNRTQKHQQREIIRCPDCYVLSTSTCCEKCSNFQAMEDKKKARKQKILKTPAKLNAPIKFTSPERILLSMQDQRKENKLLVKENTELKNTIDNLQKSIEKNAVPVANDLHKDLQSIFSSSPRQITPFMKLFWEEQMKYIGSSSSGVRYHPMIIKYCLGIYAKSPAAYEQLRKNEKEGTGVLVLPSQRTLRDYRNYIRPQIGYNSHVIQELSNLTKNFTELERFVILMFDEMKVQDGLVYAKYTGELIGFVDLGDIEINQGTLENMDELATHVLVFLVKSFMNSMSYSLATFATTGVTSFQLYPIFWKGVAILELQVNLKVIAATCDGASQNRKFFRMHPKADDNNSDVMYKTKNVYAKDGRSLWFIPDPPHLLKTARNCLSNSGSHKNSRYLLNNGKHLLWSHISSLYYDDMEGGLDYLPHLTLEHIKLTSYSVMNVRLAAQVLSNRVGSTIIDFGPEEAKETGKFCLLMDKFFDCCNVTHRGDKPSRKEYSDINDDRFRWLREEFLPYFDKWKASLSTDKKDKGEHKKFISWQTYEGLKMTVNSLIEVTQFLLNAGFTYVLPGKCNQDDLENYFGKQRAIGSRRENPTVYQVGYGDNIIKSQFSIKPSGSNVLLKQKQDIDNTPVPKKKWKHSDL